MLGSSLVVLVRDGTVQWGGPAAIGDPETDRERARTAAIKTLPMKVDGR